MSEADYYEVKEMMFGFMAQAGVVRPNTVGHSKSNAKYYYRQALRYGDLEAAADHWKRFDELGGDPKDLPDKVKLAHPLAGLPKMLRHPFRQSLTEEQNEVLVRAMEWWAITYPPKCRGVASSLLL